jgi:hypothetical protein
MAVAELKAFTFHCIWVMAGWIRFFAVFIQFFGGVNMRDLGEQTKIF